MLQAIQGHLSDLDKLVQSLEGKSDPAPTTKRVRKGKRRQQPKLSVPDVTNQSSQAHQTKQPTRVPEKKHDKPVIGVEEDPDGMQLLQRARAFIEAANRLHVLNAPTTPKTQTTSETAEQPTISTPVLSARSTESCSSSVDAEPANSPCTPDSLQGETQAFNSSTSWQSMVMKNESAGERDPTIEQEEDDEREQDIEEGAKVTSTGPYMWVPLAVRGTAAKGSATIFFHERFQERTKNEERMIPSKGDCICLEKEEYCVLDVDLDGLRVKLNQPVQDLLKSKRLSTDGFYKVFVKLGVDKLTDTQRNRARQCGKGKIFQEDPEDLLAGLSHHKQQQNQKRIAKARRRQAVERTKMANEDEYSRLVNQDERQKQVLEQKARELQRKTRQRLKEKQLQKKLEEMKAKEEEERRLAEEEKLAAEAREKALQAAKLSQRRVLERKEKQARQQQEQESVSASGQQPSNKQPDLQKLSQQRVRKHLQDSKRKRRQDEQRQDARLEQESAASGSRQSIVSSGLSEHEIRMGTRRRQAKFEKLKQKLEREEEARYSHKAKTKSIPMSRNVIKPVANIATPHVQEPHLVFSIVDDGAWTQTQNRNQNQEEEVEERVQVQFVGGSQEGYDLESWRKLLGVATTVPSNTSTWSQSGTGSYLFH